VRNTLRWMIFGWSIFLAMSSAIDMKAQGVEVSATVVIHSQPSRDRRHKAVPSAANVVVWLSPLQPMVAKPASATRQTPYRLVQKDKMFMPHLLVVPTGSQVEFPNEDPFFHNVFSLFNGKRFDLGLYESGTSRSVRFDREGASYIFCNIHPEMGAVVLALSTPFYGISGENGAVYIRNVPPGSYRLNLWSENGQTASLGILEKIIQVSTDSVHLGEISLLATPDSLQNHKNKFGEDYQPTHDYRY
jgi:plastocyanin